MYHIHYQGSTVTFRSNFYRVADRHYVHPEWGCDRGVAGVQTAAQLQRLM